MLAESHTNILERLHPQRHRVLTIILVIFSISTSVAASLNLIMASEYATMYPDGPTWTAEGIFTTGVIGLFSVLALSAIWRWRKWGVYLYAATLVLIFILQVMMIEGITAYLQLMGGSAVVYFCTRQWNLFA